MTQDNITSQTLPDGGDVAPADGSEAVSQVGSIKDTLKVVLNKEFPDDDTALKAVKDTFAFVGEAGKYKKAVKTFAQRHNISEEEAINKIMENLQDQQPSTVSPQPSVTTPDTSKYMTREEFEEITLYEKNPQLKHFKPVIDGLKATTQKSARDIVENDDTFKSLFSKVKAADELETTKSVLHSNPRLSVVTDKMTKAKEALDKGDDRTARKSAISAVIDAYGMDKAE